MPILVRMTSEVEKRPMLVTVSIGVNGLNCSQICWGMIEKYLDLHRKS